MRRIECHSAASDGYHDKSKGLSSSQLGGRVLILDEASKRVKVLPASENYSKPIWISRYYLYQEIHEEIEGSVSGEVGKLINEMSNLNSRIQNASDMKCDPNYITKHLNKFLRRLRQIQDGLEKE